jgi:multidrug efflux system outer membrane protein
MNAQTSIIAALLGAVGSGISLCGCATKEPPTSVDIREHAGTLSDMDLTRPWRAGGSAAEGSINDNWLASFNDDALNALVAEAMLNNPDLRITATRVQIAGQYVELAKAQLRPSINLFGTGGINAGGGDITSALQGISLGVSWEPDLWARMRYGRNAAQATYASVQADFEFGRQSLAATIARSWFFACETGLQARIAQEMLVSARDLVTLAHKRQEVGRGPQADVTIANANLGTYQDAARQVQFAHEQALRALELLVGRYPSAELAARQDLLGLPGPIPSGLPIEMLERRPDMIAAERRVAAAFNRVGEAKAARLPRLILNANIAVLRSDILELKTDYDNPSGGAGVRLVAPIYTGGALATQVEIRTLEQKEAIAQYARTALSALGDVESALAAAQSLAEREATLWRVLTDQERVLELSQTSYRVGIGDLRAVQQQQVNVHAARLALLRVQSEALTQRVNLHLALGGSFEALTEPSPNESTHPEPKATAQKPS